MATVQSVLDLARLDINDSSTNTASRRWPDSDLLKFANDGIAKALVMRPDLRFGSYGTAYVDLAATASFPLPLEYRPAIASYVVACNQSGDDQFVLTQRADMEMARYLRNLGMN